MRLFIIDSSHVGGISELRAASIIRVLRLNDCNRLEPFKWGQYIIKEVKQVN